MWGHNRNHPLISFARILLHSRSFVEQNSKHDTLRGPPLPCWYCPGSRGGGYNGAFTNFQQLLNWCNSALKNCTPFTIVKPVPFKPIQVQSSTELFPSHQLPPVQPPRKGFEQKNYTNCERFSNGNIPLNFFFSQCQCFLFRL